MMIKRLLPFLFTVGGFFALWFFFTRNPPIFRDEHATAIRTMIIETVRADFEKWSAAKGKYSEANTRFKERFGIGIEEFLSDLARGARE